MTMLVNAHYQGTHNSCGFLRHGTPYRLRLEIVPDGLSYKIHVRDTASEANCPYSSLFSFLENWKIIQD